MKRIIILALVASFFLVSSCSKHSSMTQSLLKQGVQPAGGLKSVTAEIAPGGFALTDPYADKVADYVQHGTFWLIPRIDQVHFELPYTGPVLGMDGRMHDTPLTKHFPPVQVRPGPSGVTAGPKAPSAIPLNDSCPSLDPPSGQLKVVILKADFTDEPGSRDSGQMWNKMFSTNGSIVIGSFTEFYQVMSHNKLHLTGDVYPTGTNYYHISHGASSGLTTQDIIDILNQAIADGVDFTKYDNFNRGEIDACFFAFSVDLRAFTSNDSWVFKNVQGKDLKRFSVDGDSDFKDDNSTTYHEFGHQLGLLDYYDYGGDPGYPGAVSPGVDGDESQGIGVWDLMCAGNSVIPPAQMSALNKIILQWDVANNVTTDQTNVVIHDSETNSGQIYRLWTNGGGGKEYFLIENRQRSELPGKGLAIWHVDEQVYEDYYYGRLPANLLGVNDDEDHQFLGMEEACGDQKLKHRYLNYWGGAGDVWPYGSNGSFSAVSTPNSNSYTDVNTLVRVSNIRKSGADIIADLHVQGPSISLPDFTSFVVSGTKLLTPMASSAVVKVEYYVDDILADTETSAPFAWNWDTTTHPFGLARVKAIAYDSKSQTDTSEVQAVVDNDPPSYPLTDTFDGPSINFAPVDAGHDLDYYWVSRFRTLTPYTLDALRINGPAFWHLTNANAVSPPNCMAWTSGSGQYGAFELDVLVSHEVDYTGIAHPSLVMDEMHDLEYNYDFVHIYISTDDGATLNEVAKYTGTATMQQRVIDLTAYAGQKVRFFFVAESDAAVVGSGWFIDDVVAAQNGASQIPTVTIVQPTAQAVVNGKMDVTVNTSADVTKVEYYIDGGLAATVTTAPFDTTIYAHSLGNKQVVLKAKAYNAATVASIDERTVLLYNLVGDTDDSGLVDNNDVLPILEHFGMVSTGTGFMPWWDVNGDGVVDERDMEGVARKFGNKL
jgi:M6 family metalloprotease-like protein